MENIMIVSALTTQTAVGDVLSMTAQEVMVIGDGKEVITATTTAAQTENLQNIQFMTKTTNGNLRTSVSIPRRSVVSMAQQNYSAPQPKIMDLGTGVALGALIVPTEGAVEFLIKNLSYNHAIAAQRITYSDYKNAAETADAFVTRVIAGINAAAAMQSQPFVVVTKLLNGANLGIRFTASDEHVDLYVGVSGILASNPVTVSQYPKVSTGKGADVLAAEKLASRHLGNQGYETNADLYYSQPFEASAASNYDVVTLSWQAARLNSPVSGSVVSTSNQLQFAFVAGGTDIDDFVVVLGKVFPNAFDATGGTIAAPADLNEIDNVDEDIV